MMPPKDMRYIPLSQHDIDEGNEFHSDSPTVSPLASSSFLRWERAIRGILFLLSALSFALWITSMGAPRCSYVVKYSPANEAIEYIERVKYKGGLRFTTPWRGDESGNPSLEIDSAWRRISMDVKPIRITEEQLFKMGMSATPTTVGFPEEHGGGYLASLEVTHHLQCLDMLRKAIDREYYGSFDKAFQVDDETLMTQLDTCVEVLLQALLCFPDLNMVTYYWVHGYKGPYPDPNTVHRCKNFDKILDWAAEKAVNIPSRQVSL